MGKKQKMKNEKKEKVCIHCGGKIPHGEPVCRHCQDFRNGNKELIFPRRDQARW